MNKVVTINLNGNAYQLEEEGYENLRAYLESAHTRLAGNPDRDEIISDIERAIAEKFRALLGNLKTVVETREVASVVEQMGPIESEVGEPPSGATAGAKATGTSGPGTSSPKGAPVHRLYRIKEGAMWSGVCNGLGVYLGIDPTFIRLLFVFLTFFVLTGVVVYVVMAIVVPEAATPEEKAAASGMAATAQEFIHRAKEGYYESLRGFPDKQARREWRRKFRRDIRAGAEHWRWCGSTFGAQVWPGSPASSGLGFALPLFSLLIGAATVFWLCAMVSLLATKSLFGIALPASLPVWLAAVLLLFAYGAIAGPLKLARRACYWGLGQPKWSWSFIFLFDALVGVAVFFTLLWLGFHYLPEIKHAIQVFPELCRQAVEDIRLWWNSK